MNLGLSLGLGYRARVAGSGGGEPSVSTLSYFDGELSFTVSAAQTGQYADGSYWAAGDVIDMAPAFETGALRVLANSTSITSDVHGWMVNPGNAAQYKTGDLSTLALRQAVNYGVGSGITLQSYDEWDGNTVNLGYDAALRQALPITAGTVVKAKSRMTNVSTTARPALDYLAVLTLVDSVPTVGSIRPPISRSDKTPVLNTSQINLALLRNLTISGVPSYQTLLDWLSGTHTFQHSRNANSRNIVPFNGLGLDPYFGTTALEWSQVLLAMHSDSLTSGEKTTLAIQIGKIASDIAAAVYEGRIFSPNGGHSIGRLPILAFAAELFDSAYLRNACAIVVETPIGSETAVGYSVFGDLGQLYYVTQAMIDDSAGRLYPFPPEALGWPNWGSQYAINPNGTVSGNLLGLAVSGTDNTGVTNAASYGSIAGKSYVGGSLALRLMQGVTPAVPQLLHDYADRYAGYEISGSYVLGEPVLPPSAGHHTPTWVKNAYTAFSPIVSVWTPPSGDEAPVTAAIYGQSEMEYLLNTGSVYRQITQPTPGDGNLIVFTQNGDGVAPVRTVVNAASVAAGQVNPAMAALSALLAFVRPGRQFVIGDASVPGTSRSGLHNGDEADGRLWSDFTSVVSAIEAEFGSVGHLIECWYNSDAQYITNFRNAFWPIYFGTDAAGSNFTLGGTNAVTGSVVANCLWDGTALASEKGRGVFARSQTMWHVLTPMPFCDGPVAPTAEATGFSQGLRNSEPARATMHGLASDSLAQSVNLRVGPSAHISDFGGGIHPVTNNADGQILLTWPIAVALMRAAGLIVGEPTIVGIEGPTDGSYADLVVDLPNGGTLTTLRAFRGAAMPATPSPHQQTVTGVEISRAGGARRPVFRTTETSYPVANRGTVTITDTGSGNPRRGRVRIAPETPFAFGDSLSYLRGQANAMLQEPRDVDNKLMLDMMIEHVPGFYDNTALYPFEGIAVRPFQEDVSVLVPAPAFTSRGAFFDGATRYVGNSISVPAGAQGLASFWFRHSGAWATGRTIMEARVGTTSVMSVITASTGRLTFRLNQDGTGTDLFTPPTNTFVADQWQHILWAWDYAAGRFQMYLNGVALNTAGYSFAGSTKFDMAGANLTQWAVGATTASANLWVGDMGHLWVSVNQTLDLSVQANREKFALGGAPVNLGPNGQLPTGVAPEWYYDGDAPAWANQGTAGNVTLTGALTPSSTPPSY